MKLIHKAFLVALGLILAGCTSIDGVPSVGTFPPGTLNKVKSVTHWKLIAQDVARQAALTLGRGGHTDTPLFLKMSDQPSLFERNFLHLAGNAVAVADGHGMIWTTVTQPPTIQVGNVIRNNRFELTNDDFVWARAPQSG